LRDFGRVLKETPYIATKKINVKGDNEMPNDQYGYPLPPETPDTRYTTLPPNAKGFAIASMVIGIVSICFSWTIVFFIASIVGIALAVASKKQYRMAGLQPHGMATAGLVLNIIGVVFNGLVFLGCIGIAFLSFIM
jgi:hypothetical protein